MDIRSTSREVVYAPVSTTPQRSLASRSEPVEPTVPTSVPAYFSPVFRYDSAARVGVIAFLDDTTGEVKDQIPAEKVIEQYRRLSFRRAAGIRDSEMPPELPPNVESLVSPPTTSQDGGSVGADGQTSDQSHTGERSSGGQELAAAVASGAPPAAGYGGPGGYSQTGAVIGYPGSQAGVGGGGATSGGAVAGARLSITV